MQAVPTSWLWTCSRRGQTLLLQTALPCSPAQKDEEGDQRRKPWRSSMGTLTGDADAASRGVQDQRLHRLWQLPGHHLWQDPGHWLCGDLCHPCRLLHGQVCRTSWMATTPCSATSSATRTNQCRTTDRKRWKQFGRIPLHWGTSKSRIHAWPSTPNRRATDDSCGDQTLHAVWLDDPERWGSQQEAWRL